MLIDRHHVSLLIDFGAIAQGKTAGQLAPLRDRLDAFLNTLDGAASLAARRAFADRMQRLPAEDRPWAAVRRPNPGASLAAGTGTSLAGPPAALLVLGQEDDDPDSDEDGNRVPSRGTAAAGPWAPLHDAFDRWDAAEILRWAGPLGWQQPDMDIQRRPDVELVGPTPGPEPATPAEAATRAAQEADTRSQKTLRTVGIAAAAGGAGALLLGLGLALRRPAMTSQDALAGAKDDTP